MNTIIYKYIITSIYHYIPLYNYTSMIERMLAILATWANAWMIDFSLIECMIEWMLAILAKWLKAWMICHEPAASSHTPCTPSDKREGGGGFSRKYSVLYIFFFLNSFLNSKMRSKWSKMRSKWCQKWPKGPQRGGKTGDWEAKRLKVWRGISVYLFLGGVIHAHT